MKKKWLIGLLSVLLLVVVSCSYFLYIFKFKHNEIADEELDQVIKGYYAIKLPNGTLLLIENKKDGSIDLVKRFPEEMNKQKVNLEKDGSNPVNNDEKELNESIRPIGDSDSDFLGFTGGKDNSAVESTKMNVDTLKYIDKVTVSEIKKKYKPVIQEFQKETDDRIEYLIDYAKKEYETKKIAGESPSYMYMYKKYTNALNDLEDQNFVLFNGIMESLEKGLETNGYNKAYSKSFRDENEDRKQTHHDKVLNEAIKR